MQFSADIVNHKAKKSEIIVMLINQIFLYTSITDYI